MHQEVKLVYTSKNKQLQGIHAFKMKDVVNEDKYCVNALNKEIQYLVSFDIDRLLAGFRETAGLDMKGKTRYEGWENMLIGGHTMGHYLAAMAQAYSNPGVLADDKLKIKSMTETIIDELLICQVNSKGQPGFIFGATINDMSNVESQFDYVEEGKTDIFKESWVPWYTMHKILAGIIEVYKLMGNDNALKLAKGLGDWTYDRSSKWDEELNQKVLNIEYGGMNDCLYELYSVTGEDKYAIVAHRFDEERLYQKVLKGEKDTLVNTHANTTIPKYLGAINRYCTCHGKVVDGKLIDASKYLEYVESFWQMVIERHTYVTGGNSEWEHFREDYKLNAKRTNCNCETCNVHNMLKLSRTLFMITGNKKYSDYYEQAYINAILPSQNPETGMSMYFQPMATGYFKVFSRPYDKFWCCTGTGMENFTKLNDSIFFYNDQYVFVNIYENASLKREENDKEIDMKAELQKDNLVYISMSEPSVEGKAPRGLALRIPDWSDDYEITIDGMKNDINPSDGYIFLEDVAGKKLMVSFQMKVVAKALPDSADTVAFKYGPFVLSGNLGTKDMTTTMTGVDVTIPESKVEGFDVIKLPEDVDKDAFLKDPADAFSKEVDGEWLTMTLKYNGLKFNPHYNRYKERYGLYFEVK